MNLRGALDARGQQQTRSTTDSKNFCSASCCQRAARRDVARSVAVPAAAACIGLLHASQCACWAHKRREPRRTAALC